MSSNSESMLQDSRAEFAALRDFVTGEEAQAATVDAIERGLFRRFFAVGATLLTLFFVMRAQAWSRAPILNAQGVPLPSQSEKKRTSCSIVGKIPCWRPSVFRSGEGGARPLDAALSRARDGSSDLLRETVEYLRVHVA